MDEILKHTFTIKRVHRASDEEYLKALDIYNTTTPNDIKAKSNEISMWVSKNGVDKSFELLVSERVNDFETQLLKKIV